ncbi:MAG: acetylxylan esterase [Planctomycetes bacterium]|nr:acetylxylan esterase [Planctomycetota bacterium]
MRMPVVILQAAFLLAGGPRARAASILYDPPAIAALAEKGDPTVAPGKYRAVAWVQAGVDVEVTIAGRPLSARDDAGDFRWIALGDIEVKTGGLPPVAFGRGRERIGYLGLLADPNQPPESLFALSRVAWDRADPPPDERLAFRRDTNTPWSFAEVDSREAWDARRARLRDRVLFAAGLYPPPPKPPLASRIYGRVEGDGFTVDRVIIATWPGIYLTGNLWKPKGLAGRAPGILCPHGHWGPGRFQPEVQLRCQMLARLGAVVFAYDMVGFGDSKPIPHRFGSDADALYGVSAFGLQTWNSIRAMDFLLSLPEVDPERIACTGASGGGTQTFILMAIEDRLKVAAPVCMISHSFQGGCICENGPGLRIDLYNVEIAATFAPKPMIHISATGDWTKAFPEHGFPEIRKVYGFFDAQDRAASVIFDAGHNYNKDSREAVYRFFGKTLFGRSDADAIREAEIAPLPRESLTCWAEGVTVPADALDADAAARALRERATSVLEGFRPTDAASWGRFRETFGRALALAAAARIPAPGDLACEKVRALSRGGISVEHWWIGRKGKGDRVPAILYIPAEEAGGVVAVSAAGKAALANRDATPGPLVADLLSAKRAVLAIDAYRTGEYETPIPPQVPPESGNYFTTYNRTRLMCRIQDILTASAFLRDRLGKPSVDLCGLDAAGPWALLAAGVGEGIGRIAIDLDRFDYAGDEGIDHPMYMPHVARLGGLRVLAALAAPRPLLLHDADALDLSWICAAYEAAGARANLEAKEDELPAGEVARWIAGPDPRRAE